MMNGNATYRFVLKTHFHQLFVSAGHLSQAEMEKRFIDSFVENIATEDGVSFVEFEEYYEGLSLSIQSDESFVNMMRNCWGV